MNAVTICGKEYQLCMTVEAFDQITQACGGMDKLGSYLDGDGDIREMVSRTASVLAVLLREGEENRRLLASFCADGDATARKVPTEAELRKLLTPRQLVASPFRHCGHQRFPAARGRGSPGKKRRRRRTEIRLCATWLRYWGRRAGMPTREILHTPVGKYYLWQIALQFLVAQS